MVWPLVGTYTGRLTVTRLVAPEKLIPTLDDRPVSDGRLRASNPVFPVQLNLPAVANSGNDNEVSCVLLAIVKFNTPQVVREGRASAFKRVPERVIPPPNEFNNGAEKLLIAELFPKLSRPTVVNRTGRLTVVSDGTRTLNAEVMEVKAGKDRVVRTFMELMVHPVVVVRAGKLRVVNATPVKVTSGAAIVTNTGAEIVFRTLFPDTVKAALAGND